MTERDIMALEDRCRYLERELSIACARIQVLEGRVKNIEIGMTTAATFGVVPRDWKAPETGGDAT